MDELKVVGASIATDVVKNLAKDMMSFLATKLKDYCVDTTNKELIDSGWAFEEYIRKTRETYSKSKTILYRSEEKELSRFFEPMDLQFREYYLSGVQAMISGEDTSISSKKLSNVLDQGTNVLITGIGGMGKTILMKHFCVNAIDDSLKIPVFVSLRWFNDMDISNDPMEKLIYDRLVIGGFKLGYEYFLYSLEGDKYVFLLDGYDEISSEKQFIMTRKISDFTKRYSDNAFVMSSRPIDQIYCWDKYRILELLRLTEEQVKSLIMKLDYDTISKMKFIGELKRDLYKEYKAFVSVPLTLSILFVTYVEQTIIPKTLPQFYEKAFETLLYRHDQMKEGYERVLKSSLGYEDFRKVFLTFCFISYFKDEYSFSNAVLIQRICESSGAVKKEFDEHAYKSDLVDVSCMLIRDGSEYTFIHRSFQEYYAALYVSKQTDVMLNKLCSALIHTKMPDSQDRYVDPRIVRDFLDVLCRIEPIRFEHIVLQPIREKIKGIFEENNGDLLKTTAAFYILIIRTSISPDGIIKKSISWNCKQIQDLPRGISTSELFILHYFSENVIDLSDVAVNAKMNRQINDVDEESASNMLVNPNLKGSFYGGSFEKECGCSDILSNTQALMLLVAKEIQRYENIVSQNKLDGQLQDIIASFLP